MVYAGRGFLGATVAEARKSDSTCLAGTHASLAQLRALSVGSASRCSESQFRRHVTARASLAEMGNEVKTSVAGGTYSLPEELASHAPRKRLAPTSCVGSASRRGGARVGRCEEGQVPHGGTHGRDVVRAGPTSLGSALCPARRTP